MKRLHLALTLAVLGFAARPALALNPSQPPVRYGRTYWGVESGLVFGTIHALAQDHDGYLWLGTDDGLVRFDGTSFVPWPLNDGTPSQRLVRALLAASDGSLWIASSSVERMLHGHVTVYGPRDGLSAGPVSALAEEPDGTVWAGSPDGALRFRHGRWERAADGLPHASASRTYTDRRGGVWVASSLGAFHRPLGVAGFERVTDYAVNTFDVDSRGEVWTADVRHGVQRHGRHAVVLSRFVGQRGMTLLRDRDGNLWVGTVGLGVWRLTTGESGVSRAELLSSLDPSRAQISAQALLEDRDGNLWIATGQELVKVTDNDVTMVTRADGLPDGDLAAVAVTKDRIVWAATSQGLYSVRAVAPGRFVVRRELPDSVTALHVDADDHLWLATFYSRSAHYEVGTFARGAFSPVRLPPDALRAPIGALTTDGRGALWMCDPMQGLLRWNGEHVDRFDSVGDLGRVLCSSADRESATRNWFGFTNGGVAVFDNDVFRTFHPPQDATGVALDDPATVHVQENGSVWFSTRRALTHVVNGKAVPVGDFATYLSSALLEDRDGSLWTGVARGILRISVPRGGGGPEFRLFDEANGLVGLVGRRLGGPTAARSPDGRLWFATSRGLAMIDPARLRSTEGAHTPSTDTIMADGRSLPPGSSIDIPAGTKRLEIRYGALNLSTPESMRFRYQLEGLDEGWINAGARREAFYTSLPPGRYRFRVAVTDRDGRWNTAESPLALRVMPGFTQTNGFYALVGFTVLGVVGGAWWLRLRVVKGRFASILAERARVAREIHDTLLQSLGSVAIELEAVTNGLAGAPPESINTLRTLRRRVTESVRETRESIEHLRSTSHSDQNLLVSLGKLAKSSVDRSGAACALKVSGTYQPCAAVAEHQLLRIAQEAISNALRHGRARSIEIELEYQRDSVLLRIADDGCGFNPGEVASVTPRHWGIATMRERAAMVGASFHIESRVGAGAEVQVVAPLAGAHGV